MYVISKVECKLNVNLCKEWMNKNIVWSYYVSYLNKSSMLILYSHNYYIIY